MMIGHYFTEQGNVVEFNFLGKDSIPYHNLVPVDKKVFDNLESFCQDKKKSDLVFDVLSTRFVNRYLARQEPGLCSKSFRTWKANIVFQEELDKRTNCDDDTNAKVKICFLLSKTY
jgi:DNA topoisomerase-1